MMKAWVRFSLLKDKCANGAVKADDKPALIETQEWLTRTLEGVSRHYTETSKRIDQLTFSGCQMSLVERWNDARTGYVELWKYPVDLKTLASVETGNNRVGSHSISEVQFCDHISD